MLAQDSDIMVKILVQATAQVGFLFSHKGIQYPCRMEISLTKHGSVELELGLSFAIALRF